MLEVRLTFDMVENGFGQNAVFGSAAHIFGKFAELADVLPRILRNAIVGGTLPETKAQTRLYSSGG